jgi:hypothetical protein
MAMVLAGTDETTIWWAVMGGEIFAMVSAAMPARRSNAVDFGILVSLPRGEVQSLPITLST